MKTHIHVGGILSRVLGNVPGVTIITAREEQTVLDVTVLRLGQKGANFLRIVSFFDCIRF